MIKFSDNYIVIMPSVIKTEFHSHSMLHLIVSTLPFEVNIDEKVIKSRILLLDSNVKHEIVLETDSTLVLLIDPTSYIANNIKKKYFDDNKRYATLKLDFNNVLYNCEQNKINFTIQYIFNELGLTNNKVFLKDGRVLQIINGIKDKSLLNKTVCEISKEIKLSESRTSHLFKQEVGIRLKNYILMYRLRYAYQDILNGCKLIDVAIDMGFYDVAHLCTVAKKMTGISISNLIKEI